MIAKRFDIAESSLRKWLSLQPKADYANYLMAMVLIQQGKLDEAKIFADKEKLGGLRRCVQSVVAWKKGEVQAADTYLADLIKYSSASSAYQIAQVYGYREDVEKSFEWLEQSFENRDPGTVWTHVDEAFDFLHEDPRWEPFVEKVRK